MADRSCSRVGEPAYPSPVGYTRQASPTGASGSANGSIPPITTAGGLSLSPVTPPPFALAHLLAALPPRLALLFHFRVTFGPAPSSLFHLRLGQQRLDRFGGSIGVRHRRVLPYLPKTLPDLIEPLLVNLSPFVAKTV